MLRIGSRIRSLGTAVIFLSAFCLHLQRRQAPLQTQLKLPMVVQVQALWDIVVITDKPRIERI